jgi:Ca2+-binding EF-hand superfamily protein
MSGGGTFGSSWVRPTQLKRYYKVFKDMNVDKHGKLSAEQFSRYLSEKNPDLALHSKRLFSQMMRRSSAAGEDCLDFATVLKMLYPQASDSDIAALREMSSSCGLPKKRDLIKKLEECRVLYKLLNKPGDNALTPDQMEDGLLGMGQDIRDIWEQVSEVFGPTADDAASSVDFMTFFQWYSEVQLPSTPAR